MSKMCLTFAVYHKNTLLRREAITQNIIRIGNDPRSHLRLDDPLAARMHAVLEVAPENDVTVIDLGCDGGTFVNGTRVNKCHLSKGDELQIGDTRLVLERLVEQNSAVPASQVLSPATSTLGVRNPFLVAAALPAFGRPMVANDPEPEGPFTYAMVKSGPDVNPDEVELSNVTVTEVMVLWGQDVLHVAHLRAGQKFTVGEEDNHEGRCDFFIPSEKLGATRMTIVEGDVDGTSVLLPEQATGRIELPQKPPMTLSEVRSQPQLCSATLGGHRLPLALGTKLRIVVADFEIRVTAVHAGKPAKKGLSAGLDWTALSSFALSFSAVGGLVASMAFFMPTLGDSEDADVNLDQMYLMQQYPFLRLSGNRRRSQPSSFRNRMPTTKKGERAPAPWARRAPWASPPHR